MSAYKKNLLIGIMTLLALLLLGWMILKFGDAPLKIFAKAQIPVRFTASQADGLSEGSQVTYRGVSVGRVSKIARGVDQKTIFIDALVDRDLPDNVQGEITSTLIGGTSSIGLTLTDPEPSKAYLQAHRELVAVFVGNGLVPSDFIALAKELKTFVGQLNQQDLIGNLNQTIVAFRTQVEKAGQVLDSVQKVVGNEKMHADIRAAIEDFRATAAKGKVIADDVERLSKSANTHLDGLAKNGNKLIDNANNLVTHTQGRIDEISKQLGERIQQVAVLLDNLDKATQKLNGGTGSAAQLLNDGHLYESMLSTSRELNLAVLDLKRLLEQWEQEGVSVKLNK